MEKYSYQWNGFKEGPVVVRRNLSGIKAEKYNPKIKEWEYSYKAGEYFLGIDNSYDPISEKEALKLIENM